MKKTFRLIAIFMALVLALGDVTVTALAAKSPGGNTVFEDNPFDVVIKGSGKKKKKSSGSTADTASAQGPASAALPQGPASAAAGVVAEDGEETDKVVKTVKKASGIIEVDTVKSSDGEKYKLIVTPYPEYQTIADVPTREICPVAFKDVTEVPVLCDYLPIINPKAEAINVPPRDCFTYQLFDVTYYRDYTTWLEKSDKFDVISLSLPDYVLDHFVCLLHYLNNQWYVVDNATVLKETGMLRFSVDDLSPFAIIVHDHDDAAQAPAQGGSALKSPQTGYSFLEEVFLCVRDYISALFH